MEFWVSPVVHGPVQYSSPPIVYSPFQARFQVLVLVKHCQRKDLVIYTQCQLYKGTHSEGTFKSLVQCENVATRKKSHDFAVATCPEEHQPHWSCKVENF